MEPIHKFNNGRGATICTKCSVIITTGLTKDLYCEKCKPKQDKVKNIHILPTDKPSRVYLIKSNNRLGITSDNTEFTENFGSGTQNQHIYITSDEVIKANFYSLISGVLSKTELLEDKIVSRKLAGGGTMDICKSEYSEIILTTDQDLIKDGVQAIDDEFLEWFVKNSSCEYVEIYREKPIGYTDNIHITFWGLWKIIIPKEEPKQETLEEVLEKLSITDTKKLSIFLDGMMYQQERSYSEEDMRDYANYRLLIKKALDPKEWFEQFKKK